MNWPVFYRLGLWFGLIPNGVPSHLHWEMNSCGLWCSVPGGTMDLNPGHHGPDLPTALSDQKLLVSPLLRGTSLHPAYDCSVSPDFPAQEPSSPAPRLLTAPRCLTSV